MASQASQASQAPSSALAPSSRPLDLSLIAALPSCLRNKLFYYLPPRPFVQELRANLAMCMWCQHAFNRQSRDYIALFSVDVPAAFEAAAAAFEDGGAEDGAAGDGSEEFSSFEVRRDPLYMCAGCLEQSTVSTFVNREFAASQACLLGTRWRYEDRGYSLSLRPRSISAWLVEHGFRANCLLMPNSSEQCTGLRILKDFKSPWHPPSRSRSSGLSFRRARVLWRPSGGLGGPVVHLPEWVKEVAVASAGTVGSKRKRLN
jgi:hypothetical protein